MFDAAYAKVESYFENESKGTMPSLLKIVELRELKRLYEKAHGSSLEIEIQSMDSVYELLKKHPKFRGICLDSCMKYFKVRSDTTRAQKELALIFDEFPEIISRWKRGIEPASSLISSVSYNSFTRYTQVYVNHFTNMDYVKFYVKYLTKYSSTGYYYKGTD
ncbi:MAG: hypothetical protein P1Q69_13390, partial [Candidatus Thorarchaeota archaeon]|nr:hypothetical protein [Candidatus Thorarchaeota archaeon]